MASTGESSSDPDWTPDGAGAAAPERSTSEHEDDGSASGPEFIIGFDPGTVNCGMAVYHIASKKIIGLYRLQFRESRPRGQAPNDPGSVKLQMGVLQRLAQQTEIFERSVVFIENQPPLHTRLGSREQMQTREEVRDAQMTIQAFCLVQGIPILPVSPMTYKQYMAHILPHYDPEGLETDAKVRAATQKTADRETSISWCRENLPKNVVTLYEQSTRNQKKDDAYEAAILALYAASAWIDDSGQLLDEPKQKPRRKKSEVHPRGRPGARKRPAEKGAKATSDKKNRA